MNDGDKDPLINKSSYPNEGHAYQINDFDANLSQPSDNMGLGNVGMQKKKIVNLADLPPNSNIAAQIENNQSQKANEFSKAFSARVKLTIEWNTDSKKYVLSDKDLKTLADYKIKQDEFEKTTREIETNIHLRPFDLKQPFFRKLGFKLLALFVILIYLYACLIMLQLALFNLILLGIMIIYLKKLYYLLFSFEYKQDYNYRNRKFKQFIEAENNRYYKNINVDLVGGEQGQWLELQLPEDLDDQQQRKRLDQKVEQSLGKRVEKNDADEVLSGVESDLDDKDAKQ